MLDQHVRFADKYFECLNATQSAIYAGFSEATAKQQGYFLLQREDVQDHLDKLRSKLAEKTTISQEKVLREIARLAFADIRNYYDGDDKLKHISELGDDEAAALASVKTFEEYNQEGPVGINKEIKLYNKLDGLEKLAKHLGLYDADNKQRAVDLSKIMKVTVVPPEEVD